MQTETWEVKVKIYGLGEPVDGIALCSKRKGWRAPTSVVFLVNGRRIVYFEQRRRGIRTDFNGLFGITYNRSLFKAALDVENSFLARIPRDWSYTGKSYYLPTLGMTVNDIVYDPMEGQIWPILALVGLVMAVTSILVVCSSYVGN